jgi:hypothetical protein
MRPASHREAVHAPVVRWRARTKRGGPTTVLRDAFAHRTNDPSALADGILRDEIVAWSERRGGDRLPGLNQAVTSAQVHYRAGASVGAAIETAMDVYRRSDRRCRPRN